MGFDWPHIHLLINHFPIILAVVGAAAVVVALITRYRGVWLYGVASLFFMGLSAVPTALTGDEAGEALHHPWYIAPGAIGRHEDAAWLAMWVMMMTGVVAVFAWWRLLSSRTQGGLPARWLSIAVLVGALASLGTVSWAAWLGGDIVYGSPILRAPRPAGLIVPGAPAGVAASAPAAAQAPTAAVVPSPSTSSGERR